MKNKDSKGVFGMLLPEIGRAVSEAGYQIPTPIQEQAIPPLLEKRDIMGCAQTGTGKTAAFMLPILQRLLKQRRKPVSGRPKVLILAPTRELAKQISDSAAKYGKHTGIRQTVIYGGVGQFPQVKALRRGVHVLVATPGRLLDLMEQRHVNLSQVEVFVLDEADRMLDMGFMPDVKRIAGTLPADRQSLFFSATLAGPIVKLAREMTHEPAQITIEAEKPAVDRISQKVMFVKSDDKSRLLVDLMQSKELKRVIVFTQMKHQANRLEAKLHKARIRCTSIHGNKSQSARARAMQDFKTGRARVLVATDIAARGIDVEGISHVVNYDMPREAETYIHRIGRTARAGSGGDAISFCSARERNQLRSVERLIRASIDVDMKHARHCDESMNAVGAEARPLPRGGGQRRGKGPGRPRAAGRRGTRRRTEHRSASRKKR